MTLPASRTIWEEGRMPGRNVVALAAALAMTLTALDLVVTQRMSALFDVGFVLTCLALALAVSTRDFFTVGILPPILMLGTFLLVAAADTAALAREDDGYVQAVISGLSHHSLGLVIGYLGALGVLAVRQRVLRARLRETAPRHRLPA
ncbi:DUF6542 domain-containing protein [Nocardioides sp. R-C-SC26]|uniref:DUF6542 domain-containing protein n=1 Tax=Nocardioides sp. R-C-SC26 TaxID=2870414 RepID=UPI001E301F9B|nr:DUF6542 domain-containing protein [Nocardioides sp. R-C-SC26]